MNFVKYRKSISIVMIFTMLVFGMCFDIDIKAHSFLSCTDTVDVLTDIAPVSEKFQESTTITSGIKTSVIRQGYIYNTTYEQEFLPSVARRFVRNDARGIRNNVYVLTVVIACLFMFFYSMQWQICRELHKIYNNIIIVRFIHQQDGEKVYAI